MNGISTATVFTVTPAELLHIEIDPANPDIQKTKSLQIKAYGHYTDSTVQDITEGAVWTSSNASVLTVSDTPGSKGLATGIAPGQSTIMASFGGNSKTTLVNVTEISIGNVWNSVGTLSDETDIISIHQASNNDWYLGGLKSGYVYTSNNNGSSFNRLNKTYSGADVKVRSVCRTESGVLFAGITSDYARLMKSSDGGLNWSTEVSFFGSYNGAASVHRIFYLGSNVYLADGGGDYEKSQTYRSTDGGVTWLVLAPQSLLMQLILYFPAGDGHVNALFIRKTSYSGSYIAHSSDYGATWSTTYNYTSGDLQSSGNPVWTIFVSVQGSVYGNALVVRATGMNFYRSTDYGATWSGILGTASMPVWRLADLGNGSIIAFSWDGTNPAIVYRSSDYGLSWNEIGSFNSALHIGGYYSMLDHVAAVVGTGTAFIGTSEGDIYKTIDGGANWSLIKSYPGRKVTNIVYSAVPFPVLIATVSDGTNPVEIVQSVE